MADIDEPAASAATELQTKPLRLWLVRHGITQWNIDQRFCGHSDVPLAAQGRKQARWVAQRLRQEHISTIYTSDLVRGRETAALIALPSAQKVQIRVSAHWREMAFGEWEGLTYAQIVEGFPQHLDFFTDPWHCAAPGGESLADLVQRVRAAFVEIIQADRLGDGDVVLVSHGGPLRVLLCSLLGMSLERQWQLRLDHGSLSAVDLLPPTDQAEPMATLVLLNAQGPAQRKRSVQVKAKE
ncbi:MAG TPA: histidine phosphatase family protein [Ktedonosporobacter sp.]|nr:histidine phosphatase family protein [Ktedonosporobacter sp.]